MNAEAAAGANRPQSRLWGAGGPFELVSVPGPEGFATIFRHAPGTLADLYGRAIKAGARVAAMAETRSLSYGALFSAARTLSGWLLREGRVTPGTRVAIVVGNRFGWLIAFVAVTSLGGVAVLVDPRKELQEIARCLDIADCRMALVDEGLAIALSELGSRCRLVVLGASSGRRLPAGIVVLNQVRPEPGPIVGTRIEPEQEALVAFTSGSTDVPKGVVVDHRSLMTGVFNMLLGAAWLAMRNGNERHASSGGGHSTNPAALLLSPLSHVGGYSQFLLMCLLGGKVVLTQGWDINEVLQVASRDNIRTLSGATPAQIHELLRARDAAVHLRSLAQINFHGAELAESLVNEISSVLPAVAVGTGYGMTETNGSICVTGGKELGLHPTTSGQTLPTAQIRLVGEEGQPVNSGNTGEIWVRGSMLAQGYCSPGSGSNASAFLPAGWFKTGDLGILDEEGFLHVTGRAHQWVLWDDRRISCRALECAAARHADVEEAVALNVAVGDGPVRPTIVVVLRPDSACDPAALADGIALKFPMQKSKPFIVRHPVLERTPSGKIDRRGLQKIIAELGHA